MAKIIGMSEFKKQCRFAKRELGDKLNRQVANAGAMLARNEARRIAPFHDITGAARKAIVTKERHAPAGQAIAQIGFRTHGIVRKRKGGSVVEASAFYVKFFESGTQKHLINRQGAYIERSGPFKGLQMKTRKGGNSKQQRGRLALHFGGVAGGNVLYRYSVIHPGMPARPFLKRALDNATGAIYTRRDDLVQKALMRVAGGANRSASTIGR